MNAAKRNINIVSVIVLTLLSLFCVLPLLLIVISSFASEQSLMRNGYTFFPQEWSMESYVYLWNARGELGKAYFMTIFVVLVGTLSSVVVTTLFAYPLSKKNLRGKKFFTFYVFFTMLFNGGLIPSYLTWTQTFHINDTVFALLLPNLLMNGYSIFLMRTYFVVSIPGEILEAAKIDGAKEVRLLTSIVLPLSKPILATITFMAGLAYWNDWQNGLYYLVKRNDLYTIQNVLNRMLSNAEFLKNNATNALITAGIKVPSIGIRMAISVIALVPVMILYPFLQKGFIKGITIGGIKG